MRKKVYAAWILAIIMVMSGVLCTQAETVSTGKAHGSKVNTTGETTPTEAEKQTVGFLLKHLIDNKYWKEDLQ